MPNLLIRTVDCVSPYSKFMVAVVNELISLVSSRNIQEIVLVLLIKTVCCASSYSKFKVVVTASAISAE